MLPHSRTIAGGVAAAVLGGGVTAALLLGSSPTGAAPPTSSEVVDTDDTETSDDETSTTDRGDRLREVLQPLVDSGALTEEEADAIVAELEEAIPSDFGPNIQIGPDIMVRPGFPGGPEVPGFPGGGGDGGPRREHRLPIFRLDVVAEAIGIDAEALRQELTDGATIAEIAEANGVDPQVVIDALVAEYTERVTALVEGEQPASDETPASDEEEPEDSTDSTDSTVTTETTSA
jgi:hypothetical protein